MRIYWPNTDYIYLSPHMDDVVLSCGGTIYTQAHSGASVIMATAFAADPQRPLSPFAESLHERWAASLEDATPGNLVRLRRREDRAAAAELGSNVRAMHGLLADAIYRYNTSSNEPLYASEEAIFGPIAENDPAMTVLLAAPPLPAGAKIAVPLGIGGHVDHVILRQAVERWNLAPDRVRYYEDYPYAANGDDAVYAALGDPDAWQPVVVPLDEEALAAKIAAIEAYASQISTFWSDEAAMAEAIRAQAERVGGERYWVRR
jgi:LmbE family N-acetylglucosaminyl deacetylase